MRLLFAEDEQDLNTILTKRLRKEGYSVDSCLDGAEALDYLLLTEYDAAILDVMMPKMDGFTVLKEMRRQGVKTPVLFLTARDAIDDRVKGLDLGAGDYLIKPFSVDELLARVRALIRQSTPAVQSNLLTVADLTVDLRAHRVTRGEREIELTSKEFTLLSYFLHHPNQVLSREQIENHAWDYDYEGASNIVDVYVRYLRKKIDDGFEPKLIQTLRGVGYMLKTPEENG